MKPLLENKLIFSNERSYRILRHLLFWGFYWVYFGAIHVADPGIGQELGTFQRLTYTFSESLLILIPQICMAYPMMYFVLPKFFLKGRYFAGIVLTIIIWILGACLSLYMNLEVNQEILQSVLPEDFIPTKPRPQFATKYMGLIAVMKGGILGVTTSTAIKLLKHIYIKDHHNLILQKENAQSQLQLLTAQVHPHFLFNTLNNIYSTTQAESPRASKMIMSLSDILRFVLYEGQKPNVPLEEELMMIREYISLEKIRYGNSLQIQTVYPEIIEGLHIAPLILLPFVENCFKHGTSKMLDQPWISLNMDVKDNILSMKLINSKPPEPKKENRKGIGIQNVRKRLELLYIDKHILNIIEDRDVFIVDLQLELIDTVNPALEDVITNNIQDKEYA